MLETAAKYILDLLTENEELKKFPKEFVNESVKWVKSWFLKPEDPKNTAKLEDPNKSIEVKKDIIQDKLEDLQSNAQFQKELTERLAAFEQQKGKLKNIVGKNAEIDSDGDVVVGDTGGSIQDNYDQKNIVEGKIKGKNVRIGDSVQVINNYPSIDESKFITRKEIEDVAQDLKNWKPIDFVPLDNEIAKLSKFVNNMDTPQYPTKKAALKALIAKEKTAAVIEELLDLTEGKDDNNTILLLSARLNRIQSQENKGIISNSEAGIERNKIIHALNSVIDSLELS